MLLDVTWCYMFNDICRFCRLVLTWCRQVVPAKATASPGWLWSSRLSRRRSGLDPADIGRAMLPGTSRVFHAKSSWKCTEMLELVRVFPSSRVKSNQMQTYPCSMPIWWHFWRFSLQAASPHQQHWRHNAVATREGVCDCLMVAPDGIWMWNDVDRVVYRSKSGTANNGEWLNINIWYQLGSAKLGSNWSQFWKLRYACKRLFLYNGWRRKWRGKTSSPTKVSWTFQILVLSMRPSFRQGPFFSLPRHPLHKTSKDELTREASVDEESTWLASRRRLIRYTKN